MSKHTVFVEAPPFAKFSDAEMRRLLDDERLEVLDWLREAREHARPR